MNTVCEIFKRQKENTLKKSLMLVMAMLLVAAGANAAVIASDTFSYPDGPLVGNSTWFNHSGTEGDLLVFNGQAVVEHGVPSEDATLPLALPNGGDVYFAFDFSVDDIGAPYAGTDFEYFAHFKDDGFNFRARFDVQAPTAAGDYTVGISSIGSTADATWPVDLTYGVVYRVIARYNQDTNIAQMWIDASIDSDLSIMGDDESDPGTVITGFALRQSDSDENETIRVDNLVIGDSCQDVFDSCEPVAVENSSWGTLKSLYR